MNYMISPKASIYGNLDAQDHIRIDDFAILTGNIFLEGYNHVGPYTHLSGQGSSITFKKYSSCGAHCVILTNSDDYSGLSMSNPMIPDKFKIGMCSGPVRFGEHVLLGAHVVVMPGVTIAEGCSIGAFTFVNKSTEPWGIYAGIPARRIKDRSKNLLNLKKDFENVDRYY